jgi:multiple sugar transport system substrate-binding protein
MPRPLRRPAVTAAVLAAALLTASCGAPGAAPAPTGPAALVPALAPGQEVAITWETYNLGGATAGTDTVNALVDRFEELNPTIDVTAQAPQGGTAEITQSVLRQVVAGSPPDVAQMIFSDLRYIASDLNAQPLDRLFGEDAVREHLEGGEHPYHPRAAVLGDLDGTTYGIPYVFSTPVLFYNADLFRAAGLDPADPPSNWAEVQQAADAIAGTTDAGGVYVSCVEAAGGGDWCLHGILQSNGGRALSEDGTRLEFAEPPAVEAVATIQGIVQSAPDAMPDITGADAQDRFARGQLGMVLTTSALQRGFLAASEGAFELRATGMPGFGDTPASPTNSGSALFVLATDPAEQAASWELIKFLTGPEAQTTITEGIGYVPLRSTLVSDPEYLQPFTEQQQGLVEPNVEQLDRLVPWPSFPGPDYGQIQRLMMDAVSEVVFRGADPAATLGAAQDRATELMP